MFYDVSFYKVVVLKIDVFESSIVDEKHFRTKADAYTYADTMSEADYITVIAAM